MRLESRNVAETKHESQTQKNRRHFFENLHTLLLSFKTDSFQIIVNIFSHKMAFFKYFLAPWGISLNFRRSNTGVLSLSSLDQ